MLLFPIFPIGTSYKFRVRALNILGESEPSAASRPYVVSGYSNRVYERPVAGPYITFTDAINETTIMLKWMVRFVGVGSAAGAGSRSVGAPCPLTPPPGYHTGACHQHKWSWDPIAASAKGGLGLGHIEGWEVREPRKPFPSESNIAYRKISVGDLRVLTILFNKHSSTMHGVAACSPGHIPGIL